MRKPLKYIALTLGFAFLGLVCIGIYWGDPIHFLKWFFGLVADD